MNRREAIAALTSLPEVARIQVAKPEREDVIIVECDGHLTQDAKELIRRHLSEVWPGRRVLVFDQGLRMKLVRAEANISRETGWTVK